MNDDLLTGLLVGLFIGGFLGTLVMALVATGSGRRPTRPPERPASADRGTRTPTSANSYGQIRSVSSSSMRVDLLLDLEEGQRLTATPVTEANDIDQELMELVRRYERPSQP
jgi:hypothetical protein